LEEEAPGTCQNDEFILSNDTKASNSYSLHKIPVIYLSPGSTLIQSHTLIVGIFLVHVFKMPDKNLENLHKNVNLKSTHPKGVVFALQ